MAFERKTDIVSHKSALLMRRRFLQRIGLIALGATPLTSMASGAVDTSEGVTFADGPRPLITYPQKRPLIRVSTRPPHLETGSLAVDRALYLGI